MPGAPQVVLATIVPSARVRGPEREGRIVAHGDITHIEIPVGDIEQARSFYGSVFGWQIADTEGFDDYPT